MSARKIISELSLLKVDIHTENGKLKWDAPEGVVTDEILNRLRTHKAEIIAHLEPKTDDMWKRCVCFLQNISQTHQITISGGQATMQSKATQEVLKDMGLPVSLPDDVWAEYETLRRSDTFIRCAWWWKALGVVQQSEAILEAAYDRNQPFDETLFRESLRALDEKADPYQDKLLDSFISCDLSELPALLDKVMEMRKRYEAGVKAHLKFPYPITI